MIKTAAIFPDQAARNSRPVLAAMRQALTAHGIQIMNDSMQADAAVIWSVLWAGRMSANRAVYYHYRKHQRPVIVVDIGSLQRGVTWKIALDNINREGWFGDPIDWDPDRANKLGIVRSIPSTGTAVLIATQHRRSLQAREIADMEKWVYDKISAVRQYSDRPIVIRPHPRNPLRLTRLPHGISLQPPNAIPGTYDSFDWQDTWHAVINHNSGPGVLAAIAGVRPVVHESSLAWPVAVDMTNLERPYDVNRDQWLLELAHTEYTLEEIQQGIWLRRLGSRL